MVIVAIDGPAGSGKSTVARAVARRLGFTYLDSGAMYRVVALAALESGVSLDDSAALGRLAEEASIDLRERDHGQLEVLLDGRDVSEAIRGPQVSAASSTAAAHEPVRAALLIRQRALIADGDWVAEGRDIGTVVAPEAPVKVFLTADPAERARRRTAELERSGLRAEAGEVGSAIDRRDRLDSTRSTAPLRPAGDAVEIDTTGISADEVAGRVVALVERARAAAER